MPRDGAFEQRRGPGVALGDGRRLNHDRQVLVPKLRSGQLPTSLPPLDTAPAAIAEVASEVSGDGRFVAPAWTCDQDQRSTVDRSPSLAAALIMSHDLQIRRQRRQALYVEVDRTWQIDHPDIGGRVHKEGTANPQNNPHQAISLPHGLLLRHLAPQRYNANARGLTVMPRTNRPQTTTRTSGDAVHATPMIACGPWPDSPYCPPPDAAFAFFADRRRGHA